MGSYDKPEDNELSMPSVASGTETGALERMEIEVTLRAIAVIGSEPEAMRWLGTPVRALHYATPVSLLYDTAGRDAVMTVLGRLEHGVL